MTKLREKFWLIHSRKAVRRVLGKCQRCRRYAGKAMKTEPAPLPLDQVKDAAVFEVTGIDLAGPHYLKDNSKVWIVLFTCAVYRAVHLELVASLSTVGFLQSLRRFVARRGRPPVIYSDNGTNFVVTDSTFRALDWTRIKAEYGVDLIQWKFNPPTAAWWGGWWERLIGMVKGLLLRVLGRAVLQYEELYTVLCDIEATVNARPLTYLAEDTDDFTPLTPAMFLTGIPCSEVPEMDAAERDGFERRFRYRQRLMKDLTTRFRREYLGMLVQRGHEGKIQPIKVGDMVLIGSETRKRLDWPLAQVLELLPGQDGHVRVVRVKTASGELLRPSAEALPDGGECR